MGTTVRLWEKWQVRFMQNDEEARADESAAGTACVDGAITWADSGKVAGVRLGDGLQEERADKDCRLMLAELPSPRLGTRRWTLRLLRRRFVRRSLHRSRRSSPPRPSPSKPVLPRPRRKRRPRPRRPRALASSSSQPSRHPPGLLPRRLALLLLHPALLLPHPTLHRPLPPAPSSDRKSVV